MSGFVGIVNTDGARLDPDELRPLLDSLRWRGPDRQATWSQQNVGLASALLRSKFQDQFEKQPASVDGRTFIVGCIRIDDRTRLLQKLGLEHELDLATTPDSHLVLHAYRRWAEHCPEHLNGDFAFAIWDGEHHTLFCARDRLGMRQFCYTLKGDRFIFGNSIYTLRQSPHVSERLNEDAIANFLLFGDHCWQDKRQTSFADIQVLAPGHSMTLRNGELASRQYWEFPVDAPLLNYKRDEEYLEHFREVFSRAVADRLRTTDVAISLSGGLDSSSIAACVKSLEREQGVHTTLHPVTVLYDSILPSDERQYVELVARHMELTPDYLDGGSYPLLSPPVQTTRPLELYQPALWLELNKRAADKSAVLLTGEAGDNLLAAATVVQSLRRGRPLQTLNAVRKLKGRYGAYPPMGTSLRRLLSNQLEPDSVAPYEYPGWINPDFEKAFDLRGQWDSYWERAQTPRYSYGKLLAHSLMDPEWCMDDHFMNPGAVMPEKRDPFTDLRMMEFVAGLPPLPWLYKKHLIREAMQDQLPDTIIKREKTPLGFIHQPLIKQSNGKVIAERIRQGDYHLSRYVVSEKTEKLLESDSGELTYLGLRPLIFNYWLAGLEA
jgi:asparagine synthase (glutamine-hydrolysing)